MSTKKSYKKTLYVARKESGTEEEWLHACESPVDLNLPQDEQVEIAVYQLLRVIKAKWELKLLGVLPPKRSGD